MNFVDDWKKRELMIQFVEGIRNKMNWPQNEKLRKRWQKHGDFRQWNLEIIIDALKKEMKELEDAIGIKGPDDIKDEIIDVRNVTEFLWWFLGD